jgi:hypothetical protein
MLLGDDCLRIDNLNPKRKRGGTTLKLRPRLRFGLR